MDRRLCLRRSLPWVVGLIGAPFAQPLLGSPASPHPYRVTQPDGTTITLHIRGDEYFHWEEDDSGFTVLRDAAGTSFYATLDAQSNLTPTALRVGIDDPTSAGLIPRILPPPQIRRQARDRAQALMAAGHNGVAGAPPPAIGTKKNIVIMLRFFNHLNRTLPLNSDIGVLFNHVGPDALAPTGSVRDVYLENSYGQLTLNSTVYGWVDLPHTEQYYAAGNSGLGTNVWQAIIDALNLADPLIDFSQYDENGDGFVDAIAFIHSGYGAEWGGVDADGTDYTNRIWSHRWSIPPWTSAEGVSVSAYHISPALWNVSGSEIGRIGVIAHETGHFFGLPDLYDTDGVGEGIGSYCMMANSWGFTGDQHNPPHFSAWSKLFLGWLSPTVLSVPGNYIARGAEQFKDIYKISTGYPAGEYLLIENREPYGFESTMPQGGLCIWHIDDAQGGNTDEGYPGQPGWPGNNRHYQVALLQADGQYQLERGGFGRGDQFDVYQSGFVSSIDAATLPNTHAYQSGVVVATNHRLHNISAAGTNMTFTFDAYTPSTGSCCNDLTGVCMDGQTSAACMQSGGTRFTEFGTCAGLIPPCVSSVPPNDDCPNAGPILDGFTPFDITLASTDGPADCLDNQGRPYIGKHDIWYVYQATCSGGLEVSLCAGTNFDSTLQVYEGTSCAPPGTMLGCNDDGCSGGGPSRLLISVVQDQDYLIRVGGWRNAIGAGYVHLNCGIIIPPDPPQGDPSGINSNRSVAVKAAAATAGPGVLTAWRVRMMDLQNPIPPNAACCPPPDFHTYESATCAVAGEANGCARWVGKPGAFLELQDDPGGENYRAARLQCTPLYNDWSTDGLVHVVGAEIIPSSTYEIENVSAVCEGNEETCLAVSSPLTVRTARYGDVAAVYNPPGTTTQPDAIDVTQLVNKFKSVVGAMGKAVTQLQPNLPELNADISALDIVAVVDAVKGLAYPFSGPCPCPSLMTCRLTPCATPAVCVGLPAANGGGAGAMCVKTCIGGPNDGQPCIDFARHCPGGTSCGNPGPTPGFCRDKCGRCNKP
jgi:M6 family metalloprotease-like protein